MRTCQRARSKEQDKKKRTTYVWGFKSWSYQTLQAQESAKRSASARAQDRELLRMVIVKWRFAENWFAKSSEKKSQETRVRV